MGFYDRDYNRTEQPGIQIRRPRTVIGWLILINVGIALVNSLLTTDRAGPISEFLAVQPQTIYQPWYWWKFLTYGFAHDAAPVHVLANMLTLFFLGRDVESRYGGGEFLRAYLVMIVLGGVLWAALNSICIAMGQNFVSQFVTPTTRLIGASGAVTGVVLLFALNFPHRMILLMFILPMPAWVLGVFVVAGNLFGMIGPPDAGAVQVAYGVHLAGVGFALPYYYLGWNLTRLTGGLPSWDWFKRRPRLRVVDPDQDPESQQLSREVDRILEKMQRLGESSLTWKERRTLQAASRHYRKQRRE